jgi:hypothetical protein
MKGKFFIFGLLIICSHLLAQDLDDYYEHTTDVHVLKSSPGYVSIGFQFASGNVGMFKPVFEYTTLAVPDIAIISVLNTLTGKHPDKSPFTNLWGALAIGVNVVSSDRFIVSAGANITDVIMNEKATGTGRAFYAVGSFARLDYLINKKLMVRVRSYVSKSFKNGSRVMDMTNPIDGLNPLFIKTGAELIILARFVAGVESINAVGYPGVSANRFNIKAGVRF